jgi:hypothetical protein
VAGALAGGVLSGDDGVIGAWARAGTASNNTAAIANPFTRWCIFTSGSEIKVQLVPPNARRDSRWFLKALQFVDRP